MSDKLGKFKKGPVVKLPKGLFGSKKIAESEKKKKCKENDDTDDDDFQVPSTRFAKKNNSQRSSPDVDKDIEVPSSRGRTRQRQAKKKDQKLLSIDPLSTSENHKELKQDQFSKNQVDKFSESLEINDVKDEYGSGNRNTPDDPLFSLSGLEEKEVVEQTPSAGSASNSGSSVYRISSVTESEQSGSKNSKLKKVEKCEESKTNTNAELASKVCCPFCWKQLGDALTLAVHVKQCGKDLPTERLVEAMTLHQKQIKEWKALGVPYPAFIQQPQQQKKPTTKTRKKRTANQQVNQEELELAIALSESLHEELSRRKSGVTEDEIVKEPRQTRQLQLPPPPPTAVAGRRKNKKDLKNSKLFTASDEAKASNIEQRLGSVIDANLRQNVEDDGEFFVREKVALKVTTGTTGRLQQFVNPDSKLWQLSSDGEANPKDFETDIVTESKIRWEQEMKAMPMRHNTEQVEKTDSPVFGEFLKPNQNSYSSEKKMKRPSLPLRKNFRESESIKPDRDAQTSGSTTNQSKSSLKGMDKLSYDLLRLLRNKRHTDLVLYGREEKGIRVHRIMFEARCPNLLEEVVYEEKSSGGERAVVALTCFSTGALKAFVQWVYGGSVEASVLKKNLLELQELEAKFQVDVGTSDCSSNDEADDSIIVEEIINKKEESLKNLTTPVATATTTTKKDSKMPAHTPLRRLSDQKRRSLLLSLSSPVASENASCDLFSLSQEQDLLFEPISSDPPPQKNVKHPELSLEDQLLIIPSQDDDMFRELDDPIVDVDASIQSSPYARDQVEAPLTSSLMTARKSINEADLSVILLDDDDDSCKLSNGSRDLFEDLEEEENTYLQQKENTTSHCDKKDSFELLLDEELLSQRSGAILLSPKPYKKLGKRERSTSPVPKAFGGKSSASPEKYTATQFAHEMENERIRSTARDELNGEDSWTQHDSPAVELFQATKKQKFDSDINKGLVAPSVSFLDDSLLSVDIPIPITSTPNHSSPNPTFSLPLQTTAFLSNAPNIPDPSEDFFPGGDSYLFANIPSMILHEQDYQQQTEEIPSLRGRATQKQKKKTGKRKSLSQQCRAPPSATDFVSSSTSKMSPPLMGNNSRNPTNTNSCGTPLLNYSLVDTPILKKELKRFGLKPLPRSKAKKILRHIYHETHK